MNTEKTEHYFVYGTLKSGYGNNRILAESSTAKLVGEGKTEPKFNLYNLGFFPGVTENGSTAVTGEVWSVSDKETKMRLDRLEGYDASNPTRGLYNKIEIPVNGMTVNMYTINRDMSNYTQITSGTWER
jgi:gamma-glutamylcyclotransferase (GGCT)/AIG2-like uncharacterized protein YtfP